MYNRYVSGRLGRSLLPIADDMVDLGHSTARFGSLYLTGNTIDLDGATISTDPDGQLLLTSPTASVAVTANIATFLGAVEISPTGVLVSSGNTTQRPANAVNGTLYINLESQSIEFYNSGSWIESSSNIGLLSINALGDVDTITTAPQNGQSLVWNSADAKWTPATISGGAGGSASFNLSGDLDFGSFTTPGTLTLDAGTFN